MVVFAGALGAACSVLWNMHRHSRQEYGYLDRKYGLRGLLLPLIGLMAWGFNLVTGIWLYQRVQQGAAYLLWGGAVVVQLVAGLALFNLMRW
jgi:hypothetical protein